MLDLLGGGGNRLKVAGMLQEIFITKVIVMRSAILWEGFINYRLNRTYIHT